MSRVRVHLSGWRPGREAGAGWSVQDWVLAHGGEPEALTTEEHFSDFGFLFDGVEEPGVTESGLLVVCGEATELGLEIDVDRIVAPGPGGRIVA